MTWILLLSCGLLLTGLLYQRSKRKYAEHRLQLSLNSWRASNERHHHNFSWMRDYILKEEKK